jgi:hypothetical protein
MSQTETQKMLIFAQIFNSFLLRASQTLIEIFLREKRWFCALLKNGKFEKINEPNYK